MKETKMKNLNLVVAAIMLLVTAAPSCFGQDNSDTNKAKEGHIEYGGIILRDGAMVMKDFHDSFEGDGWISGVVVSNSTPTGKKTGEALLLVVRVAKSAHYGPDADKVYDVMIDNKSSVFIAPPRSGSAHSQSGEMAPVADGIAAASKFPKDQRVSVAFCKGTHVAERLVNEGYEISSRLNSTASGTASGPAMPKFD